jgi:RimJ/RimL family protein N-acetyltransferase
VLKPERLRVAHLDEIWRWEADPRVAQWMWPGELGGPRTRAQTRATLEFLAAEHQRDGFGLCLWRKDGTAIARGGLRRASLEGEAVVEVGWMVDPEHWGQGHATDLGRAAIDWGLATLGLDTIWAWTLPTNVASQRVMQKLGMTYAREMTHAGLPRVAYVYTGPR